MASVNQERGTWVGASGSLGGGPVFKRVFDAFRAWRVAMHTAGEYGRACKLIRQERLAEAAEILKRALAATDAKGDGRSPSDPLGSRFVVAQALSTTAAKLGDKATALASIRMALPLWRELEPTLRAEPTRRDMQEWAAWAQRYSEAE